MIIKKLKSLWMLDLQKHGCMNRNNVLNMEVVQMKLSCFNLRLVILFNWVPNKQKYHILRLTKMKIWVVQSKEFQVEIYCVLLINHLLV